MKVEAFPGWSGCGRDTAGVHGEGGEGGGEGGEAGVLLLWRVGGEGDSP